MSEAHSPSAKLNHWNYLRLLAAGMAVLCLVLAIGWGVSATTSSALVVGKATDLGTNLKIAWETTRAPSVTTTPSGKIVVIWPGKPQSSPGAGPIPPIPGEFTFPASDPGSAGVPGISLYDGKSWSQPQIIVQGTKDCSPLFAWSSGENIHLLVVNETQDTGNHLVLDSKQSRWSRVHIFQHAPSQYSAFKVMGEVVHIALLGKGGLVEYWRFDGHKWEEPVQVPNSRGGFRVHMAVDDTGTVHLAWWSPEENSYGHAIIRDRAVRAAPLSLDGATIQRDEFDLGLDSGGTVILAYKAELGEDHKDKDAVHIRKWRADKWSEPELVGGKSGLLLGGIRLLQWHNQTVLSWVHRADYQTGQATVSGPVRSFSINRGDGWTSPRPAAQLPGRHVIDSGWAAPFFLGLHCDQTGRLHMVWNEHTMNYHAIIAELGTSATTQPAPAGRTTE